MLVSEAKALAYTQYKRVDAPDSELFLAIINRINNNDYDLLIKLDPERFLSDPVEITTATQALESDFDTMRVEKAEVYYLNGDYKQVLPMQDYRQINYGWWLDGDNIKLTDNTINLGTIYYRYIPEISEITSEDDSLILPDRFKMKTVYDLLTEDALQNNESGAEVRKYQELANSVELEIRNEYRRTPSRLILPSYQDPNKFYKKPGYNV